MVLYLAVRVLVLRYDGGEWGGCRGRSQTSTQHHPQQHSHYGCATSSLADADEKAGPSLRTTAALGDRWKSSWASLCRAVRVLIV